MLYFSVSPWPCPSQALQMDSWSTVCGRTCASPPQSSQMLLWLCELCQDRGGGCATSARAALEGTISNRAFGSFTQQPQALWSQHGMLLPVRALPLTAHAWKLQPRVSGTARTHQKPGCPLAEAWGPANTPKCWLVILPAAGSEGDSCCPAWMPFAGSETRSCPCPTPLRGRNRV